MFQGLAAESPVSVTLYTDSYVVRGTLATRQRCNQLARDSRERQTEMLVAERIQQVRGSPTAAQRRKVIGQGRARAEPLAVRFAKWQAELGNMFPEAGPLARIGRGWIADYRSGNERLSVAAGW